VIKRQQINNCEQPGYNPGKKRADEAFFSLRFGSSGHALVDVETMGPCLASS
jgi:hypothetical protein